MNGILHQPTPQELEPWRSLHAALLDICPADPVPQSAAALLDSAAAQHKLSCGRSAGLNADIVALEQQLVVSPKS